MIRKSWLFSRVPLNAYPGRAHCVLWWFHCSVSICPKGHLNTGEAFVCALKSSGQHCACVGACAPVFVWPQIVVSCEWTWPRRRYQRKDRNREWWFTGCFLHGAFIPPLFPPHHSHVLRPRRARSQPLFTPKQRYWLRCYLPRPWLLTGSLLYQTYSTSNRIFISGGAEALELSAGCRHLYSLRAAINKPILYGLVASVESAATADMLLCSPPRCAHVHNFGLYVSYVNKGVVSHIVPLQARPVLISNKYPADGITAKVCVHRLIQ